MKVLAAIAATIVVGTAAWLALSPHGRAIAAEVWLSAQEKREIDMLAEIYADTCPTLKIAEHFQQRFEDLSKKYSGPLTSAFYSRRFKFYIDRRASEPGSCWLVNSRYGEDGTEVRGMLVRR